MYLADVDQNSKNKKEGTKTCDHPKVYIYISIKIYYVRKIDANKS